MNSKLIGSKHPSLLIEVQINTCCQSTHLSSWQVATINPGADPIIPMNISQCPLARDAIRQVVHTGIKFTQEEFLGGIYLYSKNVRVHPGPLYCFCPWLFPHVSVPAPNFQPSIRNSWPGYPWGWVSKSFHIVSLLLQCLFPALWLLPGWSLFVFSRYFTLFLCSL